VNQPKNRVFHGVQIPQQTTHFGENLAVQCIEKTKNKNHAKTAEPIELPFWTVIGVGPVNRVLDGRAHWHNLAIPLLIH